MARNLGRANSRLERRGGGTSAPTWISSILAARPPVALPRRLFGAGVIWINDALCGAPRCRHVTLCQRGIAAFEIEIRHASINLQADRILRIIRLGQGWRCRQNRRHCENRQSQNAHRNLPRYWHYTAFTARKERRRLRTVPLEQRKYSPAAEARLSTCGWRGAPADRKAVPDTMRHCAERPATDTRNGRATSALLSSLGFSSRWMPFTAWSRGIFRAPPHLPPQVIDQSSQICFLDPVPSHQEPD